MASMLRTWLAVLLLVILGSVLTVVILQLCSRIQPPLRQVIERYERAELNEEEIRLAAARALDAQCQALYSENLEDWIDFLGRLDEDDRLTAPERERFYQQMVKPVMPVRSAIHPGDPIAVHMRHRYRVPRHGIVCRLEEDEFAVDGDSRVYDDIWAGEAQQGVVEPEGSAELRTSDLAAGNHGLTYKVTFALYYDDLENGLNYEPKGKPFVVRTVVTNAEFTVMSDNSEDQLTLVTDSKTEAHLREMMVFNWLEFEIRKGEKAVGLAFATRDSIPVGIAFDVIVLVGEREIPVGSICYEKGTCLMGSIINQFLDLSCGYEKAKIILRPNPTLARKTAGMWSIWGKDIVVEADAIGELHTNTP